MAALTSTFESLLEGLCGVAGGCGTFTGNPACREAGGEASGEGVEATGGLRPAGRQREAAAGQRETSWVREAARRAGRTGRTGRTRRVRESCCRARVPAEVRKSGSEVEVEGKSRDDER